MTKLQFALIPFAALGAIYLGHAIIAVGLLTLMACLAIAVTYGLLAKREANQCQSISSSKSSESHH